MSCEQIILGWEQGGNCRVDALPSDPSINGSACVCEIRAAIFSTLCNPSCQYPGMTHRSERFPSLLVVAEFPPNATDGGGALFRQMLKNYPPERIWWWSCFPERGGVCIQSVREHFCFRLPLRLYPNRRLTGLKALILSKAWVPRATRHLLKTVAQVRPQQIWTNLHGWAIPPVHAARLVETHRCHTSV